jgi:transcription initiation factor TFIID TATA-box-binding protein
MEPSAKRFREGELKPAELSLQSVVSVMELGKQLDLRLMEKQYKDLERKASSSMEFKFGERFQGAILKKQAATGQVTGVVFPSGRIVCTGAKTETAAKTDVTSMLSVIKQIVYPNKPQSAIPTSEAPKIQSYTATFETGYEIQLEHLALEHSQDVIYEPEIFPPLIYKIKQPKVTAYVSPKGKVLLTAAFHDQLNEAQKTITPILARFKRARYGNASKRL